MDINERLMCILDNCNTEDAEDCVANKLADFVKEGRPIVIYGAGDYCKLTISYFEELEIPIDFIVDLDARLWGGKQTGIIITSPETLRDTNAVTVIAVSHYISMPKVKSAIDCLLLDLGISDYMFVWDLFRFRYRYSVIDEKSFYQNRIEEMVSALGLLADEESVNTVLEIIRMRCSRDRYRLPYLPVSEQYFPIDFCKYYSDEVYVDCGGYLLENVFSLLSHCKGFAYVCVFEPDPIMYDRCQCMIERMQIPPYKEKIDLYNKAVSKEPGRLQFQQDGIAGSSRLSKDGMIEVEVIALDDLEIPYVPTIIKMDIEGEELNALHGAKKLIENHRPILAICIYHKLQDLYEIPLWIHSQCTDYALYVRKYGMNPSELVLYAIPPNRQIGGTLIVEPHSIDH